MWSIFIPIVIIAIIIAVGVFIEGFEDPSKRKTLWILCAIAILLMIIGII